MKADPEGEGEEKEPSPSSGMKTISASELRRDFSEVLDQVEWWGRKYIIQRWGSPAGMLLSIDEYRRLVARAIRNAPPGTLRYRAPAKPRGDE